MLDRYKNRARQLKLKIDSFPPYKGHGPKHHSEKNSVSENTTYNKKMKSK